MLLILASLQAKHNKRLVHACGFYKPTKATMTYKKLYLLYVNTFKTYVLTS